MQTDDGGWSDAGRAGSTAPIALLRCDADLVVTWCNAEARRLLDHHPGHPLVAAVAPRDRGLVRSVVAGAAGGGPPQRLAVTSSTGVPLDVVAVADPPDTTVAVVGSGDDGGAGAPVPPPLGGRDDVTGLVDRPTAHAVLERVLAADLREGRRPTLTLAELDGDDADRGSARVAHRSDGVVALADALVAADDLAFVSRRSGLGFGAYLPDGTVDRAHAYCADVLDELASRGTGERIWTASFGIAELRDDAGLHEALGEAELALGRSRTRGGAQATSFGRSASDPGSVRHLARMAAVYRDRAENDGRTGLRRAEVFERDLGTLAAACDRDRRPLSLVICDIDHFKAFNTEYLFENANKVLREVSEALTTAVRDRDRCYRYGGEELAVLLERADAVAALRAGERIRAAVRELGIPHRGSPAGLLTVSVGASTRLPGDERPPSTLVDGAARAVLAAKRSGRDRTRYVDPGPTPSNY